MPVTLTELKDIVHIISVVTYGVPLILFYALLKLDRQRSEIFWLAVWFLHSLVSEIASYILLYGFRINPNYSVNQYQLISTAFISCFFYAVIKAPGMKRIFVIVPAVIMLITVLTLMRDGIAALVSYVVTLQALMIISFSILFFYRLLADLPTIQVLKYPMFWIVSALFFSYSGKLVVYGVVNYLQHILYDSLIIVWIMHNTLTIISNITVFYGGYLLLMHLRSERNTAMIS